MFEDVEREYRLRREEAIRFARAAEEGRRREAEKRDREMRKWEELREHRRRRKRRQTKKERAREARREQKISDGKKAARDHVWAEAYAKSFREWSEKNAADEAAQAAVADWDRKYEEWVESEQQRAEAAVKQELSGAPKLAGLPIKKPPPTLGEFVAGAAYTQLEGMIVSYCLYKARQALLGEKAVDEDGADE